MKPADAAAAVAAAERAGVSGRKLHLYAYLVQTFEVNICNPAKQDHLARVLDIDQPYVSRLLGQLVDGGYLIPCDPDGTVKRYMLAFRGDGFDFLITYPRTA